MTTTRNLPVEGWGFRHRISGNYQNKTPDYFSLIPTHIMVGTNGCTRVALTAPMLAALSTVDNTYLRVYCKVKTGFTARSNVLIRYTFTDDKKFFRLPGLVSNWYWKHRTDLAGGDNKLAVNSHAWNFLTSKFDKLAGDAKFTPFDFQLSDIEINIQPYIEAGTGYLYMLFWDLDGTYDNILPDPGDAFSVSVVEGVP